MVVAIRIPSACLVVLVGAAGVGKTTLAARHWPAESVVSSDALRDAMWGDPSDQRASGAVFRILHREVERRLVDGRAAVVDATNTVAAARRPLLRRAARAGSPAIAIVLDLPDQVVLERATARESRLVPLPVVERHLAAVHASVAGGSIGREGFRTIVVLRSVADVDGLSIVHGHR